MQQHSLKNSLIAVSLIAMAAFSSQTSASQCKGLENNACATNSACSWVEGYERKDGRKVKAFCRSKSSGAAGKKVVSASKATKPASIKTGR